MKISGVILARSTDYLIARAITSLRYFDEVLVYDSGSVDKTVQVAEMFGCRVVEGDFEKGFATMKNRAIAEAKNDNVFVIDCDEFIDPSVYFELKDSFMSNINAVVGFNRVNAYSLKKYIAEWFPDVQIRAFNKKVCKYEKEVHELLEYGKSKVSRSKFMLYHNLCDDRKRNINNQLFYGAINKKALSKEDAIAIVDRNVSKETKSIEELERGQE